MNEYGDLPLKRHKGTGACVVFSVKVGVKPNHNPNAITLKQRGGRNQKQQPKDVYHPYH